MPHGRSIPAQDSAPVWHALEVEEVAQTLGADPARGLGAAESAARLARDGPNRLARPRRRRWWSLLLGQFRAPLVIILIVAGAVTLAIGEHVDSIVIFAVVVVNAAIGFVQEARALRAIEALSRTLTITATVRRDGRRERIDAAGLVRGDVVLLEAGDRVPADLRLTSVQGLSIDESMLTGESKPANKGAGTLPDTAGLADRVNMAYAGTLVARGAGEGLVVAVGDATELGRINRLIASAEELATPLTRKIAAFSHVLLWVIIAVAGAAFLLGLARGHHWITMFHAAVALAVGAIPEGLPAAVTVMLAVGVSRMARRRAIIRRLPAVEALGSATVICSDKTGTLTQNQMTVRSAWTPAGPGGTAYEFSGSGYEPQGEVSFAGAPINPDDPVHAPLVEMLRCGALCNDASIVRLDDAGRWEARGDPTEAALLTAAHKAGLHHARLSADFPRLSAVPFDADRQYMATLHAAPASADPVIYVKGSVERILSMCVDARGPGSTRVPLDPRRAHAAAEDMARRGLRVLAFATRAAEPGEPDLAPEQAERGLTFLGVQGMLDPPRPEAIEAVAACRRAGIEVKMITGDHAATAASIASMMGIGDPAGPAVLTGADMAALRDADLPAAAETTSVFARMTPEQKLRLVRALQSGAGGRRHIVAMTGDGVNDGPALRQADIGVAMGLSGTEVAKESADMVLADDNFASIEAAVEEGRGVFTNLTKFIAWTLPTNGGEAAVIAAAIALNWPLPILPVQALYVNMITTVLLGIPLIFEARDPQVMERPPRDPDAPILGFELFMRTGLVSLLLCAGAMGLFAWEMGRADLGDPMREASARTAAVSAIVVGEIFYLFSSRALLRPFWSVPLFSNMWLWAGIGAMAGVQALFAHAPIANHLFRSGPLDAAAWARVVLVGAAVLVVVETEKAIRRALAPSDASTATV